MKPAEIGGYTLLRTLATGGMGEVSLARRSGAYGFEKLVAVKTMLHRHAENESARKAFLDEARLLSGLSHPAVASVLDCGEDDGALFLVMEYVAGVGLHEFANRAPVPPRALAPAIVTGLS
ncbi:MAG: protein kinase [Myxococcota bacterium]